MSAPPIEITLHALERYVERVLRMDATQLTEADLAKLRVGLSTNIKLREACAAGASRYKHDGFAFVFADGTLVTIEPQPTQQNEGHRSSGPKPPDRFQSATQNHRIPNANKKYRSPRPSSSGPSIEEFDA